MTNTMLREGERLDDLHRKNYQIIQHPAYFCFGQDAVLLASFASAESGERVVDLCSGNGIVPILMCARYGAIESTGLEILPGSVDMAQRSVALNGLHNQITILHGDVREAGKLLQKAHYDAVTVNPPYMNNGGGRINAQKPKAIARHEICCTLYDVTKAAAMLLKPGGRFYMVHRPGRLADIFVCMREFKLEPKLLQMVYPKAGRPPSMVLIEGVRGGGRQLKVLEPLIIYNDEGNYTREVYKLYYE